MTTWYHLQHARMWNKGLSVHNSTVSRGEVSQPCPASNDVITLTKSDKKEIMASKKQWISKNQKSIRSRRCDRVGEQARAKRTETGLKISNWIYALLFDDGDWLMQSKCTLFRPLIGLTRELVCKGCFKISLFQARRVNWWRFYPHGGITRHYVTCTCTGPTATLTRSGCLSTSPHSDLGCHAAKKRTVCRSFNVWLGCQANPHTVLLLPLFHVGERLKKVKNCLN